MSSVQEVYHLEERARTSVPDVELTENDIEALKAQKGITPLAGDEIKVRQYIGVLGLPSGLHFQVDPKDSLDGFNVLYYLAKAGRVSEEVVVGSDEIGFTAGESLIDVVARVFDDELGRLLRRGLHTEYVTQEAATRHIRGQLQFTKQLTQQEPHATSFESQFDEQMADVPLNQLLLYTTVKLSKRVRSTDLSRQLERRARTLKQRVSMPRSSPDPERVTLTRDSQGYRPLVQLAEQILDETYIDAFGSKPKLIETVLINTETLFEEVVYRAVSEVVRGTRYIVGGDGDPDNGADSDIGHLLEAPDGATLQGLEPDVFLRERGRPVWIADAKWREDNSPKRENLYQVAAYQRKTEAPGVMFYPEQGGTIEERYNHTSARNTDVWTGALRVVELPLGGGSYEEFEAELHSIIADVLSDQLGVDRLAT
jgi:5-methylcytosine-specific restriction enzyme subunit McrC